MKYIVICLGNPLMGDDGLGIVAAEKLMKLGFKDVVCTPDVTSLIDKLSEVDAAIVIDAVDWGGEPGSIIKAKLEELKDKSIRLSHSISPIELIELMRRLISKPIEVFIVGVQPQSIELRKGLTPPVEQAVDKVVNEVKELLSRLKEKVANA